MNCMRRLTTSHRISFRRRAGTVLVVALLALAMMTVLLVALFHGTTHQLRGAESEAVQAQEKILADSAVALVIGQIELATQQAQQNGQAWISQPGLLRLYKATSNRAPAACYKLYSTPDLAGMVDTSGNLTFFGTDIPQNWSTNPSLYTDLNEPVETGSLFTSSYYPIVDANALTNASNASNGTQVEGVSSDSGSVQMPVAWLYQLQDGTLG